MKYRIVADSGCDIRPETLTEVGIEFGSCPLSIIVDGATIVDSLDIESRVIINAIKHSKKSVSTSCPSPNTFAEEFRKEGNIFCVVITSALSGTYNSAMIARDIVLSEQPDKKIHVVDSLSASSGLILNCLKLKEMICAGDLSFEQMVEEIERYRRRVSIRFLLGSIENLVKTGRMSKIAGAVAGALSIKPILSDNGEGQITMVDKARGQNQGVEKLIENVCSSRVDKNEPMAITHCYNLETANYIKSEFEKRLGITNIYVNPMNGLPTFYSAEKGIIVGFVDALPNA